MFRQVLMHPGVCLTIRLHTSSSFFSMELKKSSSIFVGQVFNGVDSSQLGVRITILAYHMLSASKMNKPHVLTLRAHVQRHLSLFVYAFRYTTSCSRCSLPPIQVCTRHSGTPCRSSAIFYNTTLVRPTNQLAKIHLGASNVCTKRSGTK